jgi:hypothetical protein
MIKTKTSVQIKEKQKLLKEKKTTETIITTTTTTTMKNDPSQETMRLEQYKQMNLIPKTSMSLLITPKEKQAEASLLTLDSTFQPQSSEYALLEQKEKLLKSWMELKLHLQSSKTYGKKQTEE